MCPNSGRSTASEQFLQYMPTKTVSGSQRTSKPNPLVPNFHTGWAGCSFKKELERLADVTRVMRAH